MRRVLVTGMSGTGKSAALDELAKRGFRTVDTDLPGWSEWVAEGDGRGEWLWCEDRIAELLATEDDRTFYISGCVPNQGRFYDPFDAIVLLSARADVILERIERRTTNNYGKSDSERALILEDLEATEPRLRATCTHELDAGKPLAEVVEQLIKIGNE